MKVKVIQVASDHETLYQMRIVCTEYRDVDLYLYVLSEFPPRIGDQQVLFALK